MRGLGAVSSGAAKRAEPASTETVVRNRIRAKRMLPPEATILNPNGSSRKSRIEVTKGGRAQGPPLRFDGDFGVSLDRAVGGLDGDAVLLVSLVGGGRDNRLAVLVGSGACARGCRELLGRLAL